MRAVGAGSEPGVGVGAGGMSGGGAVGEPGARALSGAASGAAPVTQLFLAATQYAAATVTAAIRAGMFGPRTGPRLLVVSNVAAVPEVTVPLHRAPGFAALAGEFDRVVSWNDAIAPFHPAGWSPRAQDALLWERSLRRAWDLGDGPVEIACESIQANPSRALADIFADSPVHVYADGLMTYGPTRSRIPYALSSRIARVLHLDLVPGLRPLLLGEYGVPAEPVPSACMVEVLDAIGRADGEVALDAGGLSGEGDAARPTVVLLGQYLSALELITQEEEERLHVRMLRAAVRAGHRDVLFKAHPSAPAAYGTALEHAAGQLGVRLRVLTGPVLAETVYACVRPELVVGCFSTALMTAAAFYGIPVARVGTGTLLQRLTPYENSNRVPLTIIDAALPDAETTSEHKVPELAALAGELTPLIRTVGYCMQGRRLPELRPDAVAWLERNLPGNERYFTRRLLTGLHLPGGSQLQAEVLRRSPAVRRAVRRLRSLQ